jgi:hypothetical protein
MIDWPRLIRALTGQPEPEVPVIQPCGTISIEEMAVIICNKLDEIGSPGSEVYLPDKSMKIYRKTDVESYHRLMEVARISYIPETHDCDDFAAKLFGDFSGLVWTDVHALDWFVDEQAQFWFIEPQNRLLAPVLTDGQGSKIRFLIGR